MPYYTEGTLTTDIREVAIDTTWESQTDWEAYQSVQNVVIENGVVMLEEFAGPFADLTAYSETDPNNTLTVTSSDSYEARLPNGANSVSRLYTNEPIDDYTFSFDIEVLSTVQQGEQAVIGWSTDADSTLSGMSNFVGLRILSSDNASPNNSFVLTTTTNTGTAVSGFSGFNLNTVYTIEFTIDTTAEEVTLEAFDGATSMGTETSSFDASLAWDYLYAHAAAEAGFGDPGSLDYDVTDWVVVP